MTTPDKPLSPAASRMESWLRRLDNWLWSVEMSHPSRWHQRFWQMSRVLVAVVRDVIHGHITLHAMSLVYTTLLSLVPFLALSFSVLKGFGVHNQLEPVLDNFLAAPLGERGPEVVNNILSFVDNIKVGVLGSVGLGILIYTVVSLIQKIERAFNEIWRVSESRPLAQRIGSYLSVIMIGPLLAFSAMGATAMLINNTWVQYMIEAVSLGWLLALASSVTPYLIIIGLFTFLYTFMPNTKVQVRHAFLGAVVAGVTWQSTVFGFTLFVSNAHNYTAIYSGFAVGILVLIWLYVTWLILLVGASVAFYSQHASQITRARVNLPSSRVDELTGLAILYRVASHFDRSGGGTPINQMETSLSVGPEVIQRMIQKMIRHGLVMRAGIEAGSLIPARSLDQIPLVDAYRALRKEETSLPASLQLNATLNDFMDGVDEALAAALGNQTLQDWVRQDAENRALAASKNQ